VTISLDKTNGEVERNIRPMLEYAITVPVRVDGYSEEGVVIYVAASFVDDAERTARLLKYVVDRLALAALPDSST
jgi:hypothetical protein